MLSFINFSERIGKYMNSLILMFLLVLVFPLFPTQPPSLAITESLPSTLVAGFVNAITGDHYVAEEEIVVKGAFPLKIPRSYISGHGDKTLVGWQLFPHFFAGFFVEYRNDTAYLKIIVKEPNGSALEFETQTYKPKKKQPIILKLKHDTVRKGLTNAGRGKISGQTNLKNIRVELAQDHNSITVYAPDGSIRYYQAIKDHYDSIPTDYLPGGSEKVFLLQWEHLPNQSKICYGHDKYHRVNVIRTTDHDCKKTFASATVSYHSAKLNKSRHFDITTSDGRTLNYRFEAHSDQFLLKNVSTPAYPQETVMYHDKVKKRGLSWGYLLKHRTISSNRYYNLDYYLKGKHEVGRDKIKISSDDPRWLRVKTLSRPVGDDSTPLITHRFFYDIPKRLTSVREIDNSLTQYRYSENFRLEQIIYYGLGDQLHHSEKYIWGDEGPLASNLLCHTFLDQHNNPIFSKRYFYDDRGNIQEEKIYGNLSGSCTTPLVLGKDGFPNNNGIESYTIKRSYSQDRFNLLLKEEEQNGKVTINHYHPNTAILISRLICDHDEIKIRSFYEYNTDFILVREITDDGFTDDKNNLSGVKTRLIKEYVLVPEGMPYQGMPQIIQEKYWDGSSERLLRKTILHYTTGGCIEKEDIYDANDQLCFSKTAKYDLAGRIKEETNFIGQTALHDYDPVGNKNYYKDFGGRKEIRMDYDCSNRLKSVAEIGNDKIVQRTTHRYDTKHNKIATKDPYGNETIYVPDTFGKIVQVNHPPIASNSSTVVHPIEKRSYDSAGRLVVTTDGRGYETHKRFNARNQVIQIEHPDGSSENFLYNLDGTLGAYTDQEKATTTYSYDFLGRMCSETNALGYSTIYTHGAFNLTSVQDAEGNVTTYSYDGAGRKTSEELAGEKLEYFYDPLGRNMCTKKGEAYHIIEYDNLDRIIEERDEDNHQNVYKKTSYQYDDAGNLSEIVQFIQGKEAQETFTYDSFNRLVEHKDALGHISTITYKDSYQNSQGQTVLQKIGTDPLGLQTITTLDALGQVASIEKKNSRNKVVDFEEHFYDENGNLALLINNYNQIVEWKHDPLNRVETLTQGRTRSTDFAYTKTGLVSSKRKPDGIVITNRYDLLGQLKETASTDQTLHYTFKYNKNGQQVAEQDEIYGTQSLKQYDPFGKVLEEKLGNGLSLNSNYDEQGRKKRLVLPDGTDVVFQYDSTFLRRIVRNSKNHDYVSYDLSGRLIEQNFIGSVGKMLFSYDSVGRKNAQESSSHRQRALFDPSGNLSELQTNGGSTSYVYDDLYQLTEEKDHSYTYDLHGNRIEKDGKTFSFNNLNEASHQTYDSNGNPRSQGDKTYTYDAFDRLIAVSDSEKIIEFRYDYQGRLLSKISNGIPTFHFYDGMKEIGSTDSSGSLLELRVLNPTSPSERGAAVLLEINQQPYIPIHDLFGNVIELLDPQGRKIEAYQYSSYGEGMQASINPWQYASKRLHNDLGLIAFGQRFYDPQEGRWLTQDPAGFVDGYNLYTFVANNPLVNFDHYGLMTSIISLPPMHADPEGTVENVISAVRTVGNITNQIGDLITESPAYQSTKEAVIDTWNNPRFQGGLQASCGYAEAVVGFGLTAHPVTAPFGVALMVHGADRFSSGAFTTVTGAQTTTATFQLLHKMGMSQESAHRWDDNINMLGTLGGGGLAYKLGREAAAGIRSSQVVTFPSCRLSINSRMNQNEKLFQATQSTSKLWPSAAQGRQLINGIEYSTHALERMSPRGLIQRGTDIVSRGVPPSVVENAIKFGIKIKGNTSNEMIHVFGNVRVVTNVDGTRVITVITRGK